MNASSSRSQRTLVLVRHAKAEAAGPTDHERRLAGRGHATASRIGHWLAERGIVPDAAMVSDAVRTTQTWEGMALAAGWATQPTLVAALYAAGTQTALDLVRETESGVHTLMVVGHNPTVASLVELLSDGEGDDVASTELLMSGYPPGSVTILEVTGEWDELVEGGASVTAFRDGRD